MGSGGGGMTIMRHSRTRRLCFLLLVTALSISLIISFLIPILSVAPSAPSSNELRSKGPAGLQDPSSPFPGGDVLAVIVPFRDRFEELLTFVPHLSTFLSGQGVEYEIWVVNQVDAFRFNRASLINVGFLQATQSNPRVNYMAMHDVDLLPLNPKLSYAHPGQGHAMHLAWLHPKYNYASFIGGILLLDVDDFRRVDGMSNVYWGWGLEDDEFWLRLKQNNIKVDRADKGLGTGRKNTFRHIHSPKVRPRDRVKCFDQWAKTRKRDRVTGLRNVNYTLLSKVRIRIEDAPITLINVRLNCDQSFTPWCDCPPATTPTTTTTTTLKPL